MLDNTLKPRPGVRARLVYTAVAVFCLWAGSASAPVGANLAIVASVLVFATTCAMVWRCAKMHAGGADVYVFDALQCCVVGAQLVCAIYVGAWGFAVVLLASSLLSAGYALDLEKKETEETTDA